MHIRLIPYVAASVFLFASGLAYAQDPEAAEEAPPPAAEEKAPAAEGATPPPAEGEAAAPADGAAEGGAAAPADGAAEEELSEDGGALEFAQAMEQLLLENYVDAARLAYVAMKKTKPWPAPASLRPRRNITLRWPTNVKIPRCFLAPSPGSNA